MVLYGDVDGSRFLVYWCGVFHTSYCVRAARVSGIPGMTTLYLICGTLALLLLIYLFVAMLKPEWF